MLKRLLQLVARDWLNRGLALGLAVIIFVVVDGKIMDKQDFEFAIRFGKFDRQQDVREHTIFLGLAPDYTGTFLPPDGSERARLTVPVRFTGPRQLIEDLRQKEELVGRLSVSRTFPDDKIVEDIWTLAGAQIGFTGVDQRVRIEIPDLRIRVLRLQNRHVDVVADLEWFSPELGYRMGEPQPAKNTVRVTCPALYVNTFERVRLEPVDEDTAGGEEKRRLTRTSNKRLFKVVRPPSVPADVTFDADPPEMDVAIPLVPVDDQLDIEVPIVLKVPTDGSLGAEIPTTDKRRETFTFIGPPQHLKRCKELAGTDLEIQAVIDLSRLSPGRIAELQREGIRVNPSFVFPAFAAEEAASPIRCAQPKAIWVTPPRPKNP
ncbi:MAG: hypothetical protein JXQ29_05385 [Planctomycetes bacterium]|nr:hypothetical protein [Planctomycetota bacterium]